MKVDIIETEKDHAAALKRISALIEGDDPKSDAVLEALAVLVENYERRAFPLEDIDPIDAIKYRMGELDINQSRLAAILGLNRGRMSEILNHKRQLSIHMIRRLESRLNIPSHVLIQQYNLDKSSKRALKLRANV